MDDLHLTAGDPQLAQACLDCPLCKHARKKQRGIAYWFVKHVETKICPNCKAYERIYGRKAYEPIDPDAL